MGRAFSATFLSLFLASVLSVSLAPTVTASADQVIVHRGEPVQVAVVLDHSGGLSASGLSSRNAVQMAVERRPSIRGFAVQLNDFDGPCQQPDVAAAVAAQVVGNRANVAVIGHMCSTDEHAALPIYEQAGVVAISGSATGLGNPAFGPDVFNSVDVPDDTPGESDAWYARVRQLPRDVAWRAAYTTRFGASPEDFADLYFDAASFALKEIAAASMMVNGDLVIDRATLAADVRSVAGTSALGFQGVTCWIQLDARGYRVNDPFTLDRCGHELGRVVDTSALSITWDAADPEQIDSLVWRGVSMTNTGTVGGLPPGCHFAEYFGNGWTLGHYPFMLVGDSGGSWIRTGPTVQIASASTGCEGGTGIPVQTTYTFSEAKPEVNSFRVDRAFAFGSTPADYDIRPYIPRLYPRDVYNQVLYPDASGISLVVDSISPCEFGCPVGNWNGSWFASNDPVTGRGVLVLRRSSSSAALWIDMDGASFTTATSAALLAPSGGFTGTVVESEIVCFYDATTWPVATRSVTTLPLGCSGS